MKFLSIALLLAGMLASSVQAAQRPNVLFVFADDLTYEAVRAFGHTDIDTPNLDELARRGTTFTHAYNMGAWGGAVCIASRTMLNTGRFVWNAKTSNLKAMTQQNQMWSQRMHDAGYRTYMSGKWHVSANVPSIFDVSKHIRGGMPQQTSEGYNRPIDEADYADGWKPWDRQYGGFWEGGQHWSEVLADDGIEFLQQAAEEEQPFFMYLAFNAPHDPRQSPQEYVDRYPLDRIEVPSDFLSTYPHVEEACGKNLRDERLMPYPRTPYAVKVNRQEYYALITHTDEQIGRILAALDETGQADETYIFFTADHGLAVGHHGLCGKQNMYDHSVRVPFMVVGPDITPGARNETPIYLQDVMATSLELAGDSNRDGVEFKSLMPLLSGEADSHYDVIYGAYMERQRMVTDENWKLIHYPTAGVVRLFDLADDPLEMNDLANEPEHAAKRLELQTRLQALMDSMNDPIASPTTVGS